MKPYFHFEMDFTYSNHFYSQLTIGGKCYYRVQVNLPRISQCLISVGEQWVEFIYSMRVSYLVLVLLFIFEFELFQFVSGSMVTMPAPVAFAIITAAVKLKLILVKLMFAWRTMGKNGSISKTILCYIDKGNIFIRRHCFIGMEVMRIKLRKVARRRSSVCRAKCTAIYLLFII